MGNLIAPINTNLKKHLRSLVNPAWWLIRRPYFPWIVFMAGLFLPTLDPFNKINDEAPIYIWHIALLLLAVAFTIIALFDWDTNKLFGYRSAGEGWGTLVIFGWIIGGLGLLLSLGSLALSFIRAGYLVWFSLFWGSIVLLVFLGIDIYKEDY